MWSCSRPVLLSSGSRHVIVCGKKVVSGSCLDSVIKQSEEGEEGGAEWIDAKLCSIFSDQQLSACPASDHHSGTGSRCLETRCPQPSNVLSRLRTSIKVDLLGGVDAFCSFPHPMLHYWATRFSDVGSPFLQPGQVTSQCQDIDRHISTGKPTLRVFVKLSSWSKPQHESRQEQLLIVL